MDNSINKKLPYNLGEIKELAKLSLNQGAVTKYYLLDLPQAYKLLNAERLYSFSY